MELGILRVLLVRHGQSEDNQNAIRSGHRDPPLTEIGTQQAKALGAALANYSFHAIYTSDLKRASKTAEEILAANHSIPPPPLVQTQSLREQNYGQASGQRQSTNTISSGDEDRTARFAEGESLEDVNARMGVSLRRYVLPRLESLRSVHGRSEPQIIIVTHEVAIAEILRVLISMHDMAGNSPWPPPQETYRRSRMDHTGCTLVELGVPVGDASSPVVGARKPVYVRVVSQNITSHLQGVGGGKGHEGVGTSTSGAGEIIIGGAGSGGNTDFSPSSLAKLNLRTVNTYDSRHLMRELERASSVPGMVTSDSGNTLGTSMSLAGQGSAAGGNGVVGSASLSSINLANSSTTAKIVSSSAAWSDAWQAVCVQILPLFNSNEELRTSIEEISDLVSDHIRRCLERSPARALDTLSRDLYAICTAGMYGMNVKLSQDDETDVSLLKSLIVAWKRFHWQTLPWLEMCFMPLQTDTTLISLTTMRENQDNPTSMLRNEPIDVFRVALTVFRDQVILPRFERLFATFLQINVAEAEHAKNFENLSKMARSGDDQDDDDEEVNDAGQSFTADEREESRQLYPRLLQMCCLLHSVQTNEDENQAAMTGLVNALRSGREDKRQSGKVGGGGVLGSTGMVGDFSLTSTSSRDAKRAQARQGWLPKSASKHGASVADAAGVRAGEEKKFLTSLRSPTLPQEEDQQSTATTTSAGETSTITDGGADVDTSGQASGLPPPPPPVASTPARKRRPYSADGSSAESSSSSGVVQQGALITDESSREVHNNVIGLGLDDSMRR